MRFQMFSARRTVDLKARRVEVNQGLDLDLRLEKLVITGACSCQVEKTEWYYKQSGESQMNLEDWL